MPYFVVISKYAARLIKKFIPRIKDIVIRELEYIAQNPHQAPQMTGKFSFLRSWHVYIQGVPYRIIFQIEEVTKKVTIHIVAKRADAYRFVERLFK